MDLIVREELDGALEGGQGLVGLVVAEVCLCEQIFNVGAGISLRLGSTVILVAKLLEDANRFGELRRADVAKREIEAGGVLVLDMSAGGEEVRNGFDELPAASERDACF